MTGSQQIQLEDDQKLGDGCQKHLIEVKMVKGHLTQYHNYIYMYIFEPADLVIFFRGPVINPLLNQTS